MYPPIIILIQLNLVLDHINARFEDALVLNSLPDDHFAGAGARALRGMGAGGLPRVVNCVGKLGGGRQLLYLWWLCFGHLLRDLDSGVAVVLGHGVSSVDRCLRSRRTLSTLGGVIRGRVEDMLDVHFVLHELLHLG